MNGLAAFFRNLGPVRLASMAIVGIGLIAFFAFITIRLTAPEFSLLYTDLDMADSAKVVKKLDDLAVPYKVSADGGTVLVPEDQVLKIRMAIAQQGLIGGGSVGYEIFDRTDALGTTSFVQNINHVRALEGELARTIRSLDNITSARVHLVLPQRQLFSRDEREPSAAIAIKTAGTHLNAAQIRGIQNLVASAVPDLEPSRVSIVDHKGVLLAKGAGDDGPGSYATTLEEKRLAYERRLRDQVESLLGRTVGMGKVRAEVAVEMDLNRITRNSESYDPDGQVVRSSVTVEDNSKETDQSKSESVSIANNLPDANSTGDTAPPLTDSNSNARTEETVNYEISKTVTKEIHEAGTIKHLSVAVLVDGHRIEGKDGKITYKPRTKEELDKLTKLVRSAIGYDAKRGDHVEVVNMRFADVMGSAPAPIAIDIMGFQKNDILRLAESLVLGLIGILIVLLVLRPLVNKLVNIPDPAPAGSQNTNQNHAALNSPDHIAGALPPARSDDGAAQTLTDDSGQPLTARQIANTPGGLETAIEVASVESRVQGSALKKVGELVERHPEEAASVVRGWLYGS